MSMLQITRRLSLKNILFATDFSAASDLALPLAKALASHYGSTMFVVHVYHPSPGYDIPVPADFGPQLKMAERQMDALFQLHDFGNVAHRAVLLESGNTPQAILDSIEENEIDLIVLGTHGREGIRKVVVGSVAEAIVRCASCPVLTVGPGSLSYLSSAAGIFQHILYATDLAPSSQHALTYALAIAREDQAELSLLHVIEELTRDLAVADRLAEVMERIRRRLREMLPVPSELLCKPTILVELGTASEAILQAAKREGTDLIVLGTHGSSMPQISSHSPWHTAHRVICEAPCPVLTVRG